MYEHLACRDRPVLVPVGVTGDGTLHLIGVWNSRCTPMDDCGVHERLK